MSEQRYRRRVRIECDPNQPHSHSVSVRDLDTGEIIPGVACVVIYLNPTKVNEAELTYWETDEQGRILLRDDKPIARKLRVEDLEVDISAYERE